LQVIERFSTGLKLNVQKWENFNKNFKIDLLVMNILLTGEHQDRLCCVTASLFGGVLSIFYSSLSTFVIHEIFNPGCSIMYCM